MRKFIEFEVHEYMDMYPKRSLRAMEESEAQNFAEENILTDFSIVSWNY